MQRIKYTQVLHTGAAHSVAPGRRFSTWYNMLLKPSLLMMSWCFPNLMSIGVAWRLSCATSRLLHGKEESKNGWLRRRWNKWDFWRLMKSNCCLFFEVFKHIKPWQAILWDLGYVKIYIRWGFWKILNSEMVAPKWERSSRSYETPFHLKMKPWRAPKLGRFPGNKLVEWNSFFMLGANLQSKNNITPKFVQTWFLTAEVLRFISCWLYAPVGVWVNGPLDVFTTCWIL